MDQPGACREMPKYQSHKKVWALKIEAVQPEADGGASLIVADEGFAQVDVDAHYVDKHKPEAGGYYVVYDDGYKSFSPAKAFEEGYTLIGAPPKRPTIAELEEILKSDDDTPITVNPDGSITAG